MRALFFSLWAFDTEGCVSSFGQMLATALIIESLYVMFQVCNIEKMLGSKPDWQTKFFTACRDPGKWLGAAVGWIHIVTTLHLNVLQYLNDWILCLLLYFHDIYFKFNGISDEPFNSMIYVTFSVVRKGAVGLSVVTFIEGCPHFRGGVINRNLMSEIICIA